MTWPISPPKKKDRSPRETVVFWTWMVVIGAGLAVMITIPLLGR